MKACGLRKAGELTAEEIGTALEESQGDLAAAAEELQVSLYGFKQRMNRLGLR
jgi:transcriptional regulator with GAF, ATPase, and Fis domain